MDKIFSIAPLLDESFLNISIKKSCTPERDTVSLCDSVAIRTQDPRLRRTSPKKSLLDLFSDSYNDVHFQKKQAYSKRESNIVSIFPGLNEGQDSISLFFASR